MRIGICGGTFDPFHHGHLEPVLAVREEMQWDRVIYIPAWRQPFKTERVIAAGSHRFTMAALAIREHDALFLSPIELERGGVSYSVETLEALHQQHEGASFDWIIGDDNLNDLERWKDPERLFELARFVVLTRSLPTPDTRHPTPFIQDHITSGHIVFAANATVPISSTEIRGRVRAGQPIDAFVDPLVSRYIHHYGLYKEGQH
jgi:nicotinate-nucleotide adenylyltransferase